MLPAAALARLAARSLDAAGAPAPASVGLILADDGELAALNAEHMSKRGPTDVLSFPLFEAAAFPPHVDQSGDVASAGGRFRLPPGQRVHLGDVVVSVERAVEQAKQGRGGQTSDRASSAGEELALLVVHGVLHVCGWDHAEPAEELAMRALERRILAGR